MGVFDVFSDTGALPTDHFLRLIAHLGPDMDPEVTPAFLGAVEEELAGPPSVTYMELCEAPSLKPKLGLA